MPLTGEEVCVTLLLVVSIVANGITYNGRTAEVGLVGIINDASVVGHDLTRSVTYVKGIDGSYVIDNVEQVTRVAIGVIVS